MLVVTVDKLYTSGCTQPISSELISHWWNGRSFMCLYQGLRTCMASQQH